MRLSFLTYMMWSNNHHKDTKLNVKDIKIKKLFKINANTKNYSSNNTLIFFMRTETVRIELLIPKPYWCWVT